MTVTDLPAPLPRIRPTRSLQAPSTVVMIRPHHFSVNEQTADDNVFQTDPESLPSTALASAAYDESTALAKHLKTLGFRFVGPTTAYAAMQAMGVVNDHLDGCWVRDECMRERAAIEPPSLRRSSSE